MMNGLIVCQQGQQYAIYTPQGIQIGMLFMNQIEIWFGIINRKLLKRSSYTSIEELKGSIKRFIVTIQ